MAAKKGAGVKYMVEAALIAALYAALTLAVEPVGFGMVQFRVSEALCVLPFFTPAAIPGLAIGCAVANLIGGFGVLDAVVGTLATLLSAIAASRIKNKWLTPAPAVLFNALLVPVVLNVAGGFPYLESAAFVFLGQFGCCYILGMPLLLAIERHLGRVFLR